MIYTGKKLRKAIRARTTLVRKQRSGDWVADAAREIVSVFGHVEDEQVFVAIIRKHWIGIRGSR